MSDVSATAAISEPAALRRRLAALAPLVVRVAAAGLAYILQVALARVLGIDGYGVYAWAWAIVSIGGYGATFGLSQIAVRHLAQAAETGDRGAAREFVGFSLAIVAGGATLLAGLAAVACHWSEMFQQQAASPLLLALAIIPFFALGDLAEGYARSQGWTILALAPAYIVRQLLLLTGIAAFWLIGADATATSALVVALGATAVTALVQTAMVLVRLKPLMGARTVNRARRRRWLAECIPVMAADAALVLRQNVDVLILAAFAPPAEVGLYFAATRLASLLGLVEFAVGAVTAHRFARLDPSSSSSMLHRTVMEASAITFWPTLLAACGVVVIAPWVLPLFGTDFAAASDLVLILAAAAVVRAWIGPADDLLVMQGHATAALSSNLAALAATVIACTVLVPASGAAGAAVATLIGTCVGTFALALLTDRHLGMLPTPRLTASSFRA